MKSVSSKKITIIQGHPNPDGKRFGHALAEAYVTSARAAGHEVKVVEVARLDFPLLRSQDDWNSGSLPTGLVDAQAAIGWADHLVFIFPIWLGTMPAMFKAFLEQTLRPGFAVDHRPPTGGGFRSRLRGKSARLVVTMGMPAFIYRWYFRAHGVRCLDRGILPLCGIKPIRETFIGSVEKSAAGRAKWLKRMGELGAAGQ